MTSSARPRSRRRLPAEQDEAAFTAALAASVEALEAQGIQHCVIGGLASAAVGRPRWTRDIDFLVRPGDARRGLETLARAGFETEETDQTWLYKAWLKGVLVDVIFQVRGIYMDDEMAARARPAQVLGVPFRAVSPEDLLVMKAIVHEEKTPRHWHDALAVLGAGSQIDWDYLVRRAKAGPRRVLSLLVYAQSNDLIVPDEPIRRLVDLVYAQG
ncbi:MAG: nucleotidyltransferase [Candidatus Dormibacterales bacterium]